MKSPILRSVSQLLRVRHREINDDCAVQMAVGQKKGANSFGRGRVHMGNLPHALQIIIKLGISEKEEYVEKKWRSRITQGSFLPLSMFARGSDFAFAPHFQQRVPSALVVPRWNRSTWGSRNSSS